MTPETTIKGHKQHGFDILVVSTMTSVTISVARASEGKLERSSVLAGQSMTSGAHEVMVRTDVVERVKVVVPAPAALVTRVGEPEETPVDSKEFAMAVLLSPRRKRMICRGCEYAVVRVAKRPRVRAEVFMLVK